MIAASPPLSQFDMAITDLVRRTQCRPVEGQEFEDVCRLRYDSYRREGALPQDAPKRFSDRFDDEPNTRTFGLFLDGRLASSIRIHHVSRETPDHPSLHVFPEYLRPLLDEGRVLIDNTRFVVDFDASRSHPKLPYVTVRLVYMAGAWFQADVVLAAVRTEHQAFYRRLSGHREVCPARPYPMLAKPISLMALNYKEERARLERRHGFIASSHEERRAFFQGMISRNQIDAGMVA
ncbi:hypothetical protein D3272_25535 [Lichenibacterium ramalinae]|uniref:N-acyl amino acid synthase FeeM catalytic core domain-containing protein n=2 Tax=Lichenibacterium ramalinae TaxID=2316527 RepID=A0A4Q2R4T2_9HYPH|nr:hypothetical protein D3272_25535 [Lichenibacterium ramalinae]